MQRTEKTVLLLKYKCFQMESYIDSATYILYIHKLLLFSHRLYVYTIRTYSISYFNIQRDQVFILFSTLQI